MSTLDRQAQPGPPPTLLAGAIIAVSRNPRHAFSKQPQPRIRLIAGEGIEDDAHRGVTVQHQYHLRRDPTRPNLCQVHLFPAEMLEELATHGYPLAAGELGENILTRGLDLLTLPQSTRLRLGSETVVEITGLRTPCAQLDGHLTGLQNRLWGERDNNGKRTRRAGVMSIVRIGGEVRPGDPIAVELPPGPHRPLGPM